MEIPADFTHLHVHSYYTLLGGTANVTDLVARAARDGRNALALTDTNALYGAVTFARACREAGIRPIIGMAVDMAAPADAVALDAVPGRLVLLAADADGYRALCRISSRLQGDSEREARRYHGLAWDALKGNTAGLICITGGRMGWLERLVRAGDTQGAARLASRLGGLFQERCYVSLELHRPADTAVAHELVALGQRFGLPPVAVQPVYCLEPHERETLRLLAAIDHNCPVETVPESVLPALGDATADLHWLSSEEMAARFEPFPRAGANVGRVVQQCGDVLPDGRPIWPVLDLPDGQSPEEALAQEAEQGLQALFANLEASSKQEVYRQRLAQEVAAITRHGFVPLFLVVADMVRFARSREIPVSTRGSVANSLVAFVLGITDVDPVAHDLLFARFLNPARANLPDIDLDFCSRRRDEVLAYVRRRYGADRVALVATVSTMQPKSAVRETAKAMGLAETAVSRLAGLAPRRWHPDPRRREETPIDQMLTKLDDERERAVVTAAFDLIGQPHHLSVHPGGLVITPGPLTDWLPVQWAPKGFLITQYDYRDVEAIGLPKIDLLGIRALTVLADTAELVQAHRDPGFRLEAIPAEDPATAAMLAQGETIGVFQCESEGAQRTLRQLQAQTVRDLAVANAFFKPGPATGGMARAFVRRYRGEEPVSFLHPALAPILGPTQGVLLFQEQILRVATEIAGLSWAQADHLRRGMSKFQAKEMAAMRLEFLRGCRRSDGPGLSAEQAETLWEQVMAFAGYGFNQGHATAYAAVSYRSAYLKAHWPAEFLCARLKDWGGFHHAAVYMAEATRLGVPIRPPHVNVSGRKFTLTEGGIKGLRLRGIDEGAFGRDRPSFSLWMGLGQVRGLRRRSVKGIVAGRREGAYADLRDLLAWAPLRAQEITHLIQCGALDGLGTSRAALLAEAEEVLRAGSVRQMAFAFARETAVPPESPLQRLAWEKHILGQPVSVQPLDLVRDQMGEVQALRVLPETNGRSVTVAGVRLPGWTGGPGFFLGDGDSFVILKGAAKRKWPVWQPLLVNGRWQTDEWGGGWLQASGIEQISIPADG